MPVWTGKLEPTKRPERRVSPRVSEFLSAVHHLRAPRRVPVGTELCESRPAFKGKLISWGERGWVSPDFAPSSRTRPPPLSEACSGPCRVPGGELRARPAAEGAGSVSRLRPLLEPRCATRVKHRPHRSLLPLPCGGGPSPAPRVCVRKARWTACFCSLFP